jgi:hypothetical protein
MRINECAARPLGGWGGGHVEARVGSCRAAAEMANAEPEQPVGKETAPNGGARLGGNLHENVQPIWPPQLVANVSHFVQKCRNSEIDERSIPLLPSLHAPFVSLGALCDMSVRRSARAPGEAPTSANRDRGQHQGSKRASQPASVDAPDVLAKKAAIRIREGLIARHVNAAGIYMVRLPHRGLSDCRNDG